MNRKAFYDALRGSALFPHGLSDPQVEGMEAILDALDASKVSDPRYGGYIFATAWHETARTMQPVRETLASSDDQAVIRLEKAWKAGRLPWVKTPYWRKDTSGKSWFGRGFVQLTHKANYQMAKDKTGIDFVGNPALALEPKQAAVILVRGMLEGWFTTKKLSDYIGVKTDYVNARRIVNGLDKATEISKYAPVFEKAFRAAWETPTPAPKHEPAPTPAPAHEGGWLSALLLSLAQLFEGRK